MTLLSPAQAQIIMLYKLTTKSYFIDLQRFGIRRHLDRSHFGLPPSFCCSVARLSAREWLDTYVRPMEGKEYLAVE